ncbi:MAG TPA: hypothetical protein VLA75_03560 [Thermoanaerobaculia bacterium]|nr:hypothetical protein [Thermoanaerobaculia bacterium]
MSTESKGKAANLRAGWPVRRYRLGEEPAPDLAHSTTPEQRVAMMWRLALDAWATSGRPLPTYTRAETPMRRLSLRSHDGA